MGWRIKIWTEGRAIRIVARDPTGWRHRAIVAEGPPARLTPIGDRVHHPCRLMAALELDDFLIDAPRPCPPDEREMRAVRKVAVNEALSWRSRFQAAAELDRLSGVVFDELVARGASPGRIGLAPALHLAVGQEPPIPFRLAPEAEMRRDLSDERRRLGAGPSDAEVVIAAMAIAAYAPGAADEDAPPQTIDAPRIDLSGGCAAGPGVLMAPAGTFVIDGGWSVAPASGAIARLRRRS